MKMKEKEKDIQKIIIKYDDGTEKEIEKGVVITDKVIEDGDYNLTFEFANMQGSELVTIIFGVTEMGVNIGLFDED